MSRRFIPLVMLAFLALACAAFAEPAKNGAISGKLKAKGGGEMAGGTVFLFNAALGPPPEPAMYWRVPDEIAPIDSEGKFSVEVVEGSYYLGAIKRARDNEIGPPREGDLFFMSRDGKGKPKAFAVKAGGKTDLGPAPEAVPFRKADLKAAGPVTAIEGKIIDADGKPVEGALVFAFTTSTMVGRPLFVSERTGKDGAYQLRVSEGGSYYLRVRDVYGGGPPAQGAVVGTLGGESLLPVTVRTGAVAKGMDIPVARFSRPTPGKE